MATYSKAPLSGSTNGRGIKVAATATAGTLIHTGSTTTSTLHEVWLYAANSDTAGRKLTIEWAGTTAPDDTIELTIAPESGLVLVCPGLLVVGDGSALIVRAFADTTNVLLVHGYVNVLT